MKNAAVILVAVVLAVLTSYQARQSPPVRQSFISAEYGPSVSTTMPSATPTGAPPQL